MNVVLLPCLTILASYLIGAIPFGYLIGRWRGIDIFQHGSGNIGATNVGRVLGKRFGILVFMLDFAKGAVPALAASKLRGLFGPDAAGSLIIEGLGVWAGLAALLGHLFSIYLRFKGGKGVATAAGVVVVLVPVAALGGLVVWLAVVCGTRYISLASLMAAVALCGFQLTLPAYPFQGGELIITLFCFTAAGLVFLRHRANLTRLLHGNENRLPESSAMLQLTKTVHVLALGLWFGSVAFFVFVVGLTLFNTFETIGVSEVRPAWLPRVAEYEKKDAAIDGPREQGVRVAGAAVAPMFGWFFLIQGVCGLLATTTSLGWSRSHPEKVHQRRTTLLLVALATVLIGWPLEQKVADLRTPRNETTDAYLKSDAAAASDTLAQMKAARGAFALWHLGSLGLTFITLVLITAAMALAARLPEPAPQPGRNGDGTGNRQRSLSPPEPTATTERSVPPPLAPR
jgi:acyl-phosphate glycerol 3-phosphate acyltransferase